MVDIEQIKTSDVGALLDGASPITFDDRLSFIDGALVWTDDGISIVCSLDKKALAPGDVAAWSYHVVKGGAAITSKVMSKKAPHEDDSRGRDSKLKKSLNRVKDKSGIDGGVVMDILGDFGLYLMNTPEAMDSYMESITDHTKPAPDPVNEELAAKAQDILKNGDPVMTIMTEFHFHHIGDDEYGRLLMLAIASQHVRNTHGIHLTPTGESGKGKTHAGMTMLHLVPDDCWIESSLSPKSLYYADIKPGTIIFSDDVVIDEELLSIIRRCITGFTVPQEHRTIDRDRRGITLAIPERIIWIIASVENFMDEQTRNRMFDVCVDETFETDMLVHEKQVDNAITGAEEFPETEEVLLCREIFRIIKNLEPTTVVIPFADNIDWRLKNNRRNFEMFLELVKAHALIRHLQRDRTDDGAIIATTDDFFDAKKLYLTRAEGEATKLTKPELNIVRALERHGDCTEQELVKILRVPTTTLHYRIHGRKDRGTNGLLGRKESLITCTHENRDVGGDTHRLVNVYAVVNSAPLSHYSDVVSLRTDGDDAHSIPQTTSPAPLKGEKFEDALVESAMKDAHAWWFDYAKEHREPYDPDTYFEYLLLKEPKYNTQERKDVLRFVLTEKRGGLEGWL